MKKKNMTEDEAFQEAQEYNQKVMLEAEEKKRLQMEKEANIKELCMKSKKSLLKEKREQKKKKMKNSLSWLTSTKHKKITKRHSLRR